MGQHVTDVGCGKKDSSKELKKHAATIHCSNSLSLLQRKISNALLYHAYKELALKEEHAITVKQLCRLIGYQGNNHAAIKEALKGLISTIIEWNLIDDKTGNENWTASSMIASVSLEGPLCFYAYSPRMKQLLHSPSMFGKIDLVIQSRFRSSYGLALYENCIRYHGLPHTKWFEMDLFKKLMGIPAGLYDIFRDFKRRVLDKAVAEVNTYSDLIIEAECVREGRKVTKLRFKLKERVKKIRLGQPGDLSTASKAVNDELAVTLVSVFGLSKEEVLVIRHAYDDQFIADKIAIVQTSTSFQQGKVKSRAGYLLSALKNNYQAPAQESAEVVVFEEAKHSREEAYVKRLVENMQQRYLHYREELIHQVIAALDEDKKAAFMATFMQTVQPLIKTILQLQRHKYSRDNVLQSPQLQAQLRQHALRELAIPNLLSLEDYVVSQREEEQVAWQKLKTFDPDHPLLRIAE